MFVHVESVLLPLVPVSLLQIVLQAVTKLPTFSVDHTSKLYMMMEWDISSILSAQNLSILLLSCILAMKD